MSLIAEGVSVRFGGLQALKDVGLTVDPGTVVSLIGPNGAGKTTFMNCLSGLVQPDEGTLTVDDAGDVFKLGVRERVEAGIGRSFQTPRVDPTATIEDNLKLGFYRRARAGVLATALGLPHERREERAIASDTRELLGRFDLANVAQVRAEHASVWRLRLLEVARAMALRSRYLMLDEPAAGLDESAQDMLARHIGDLKSEGYGILLVEHNFGFVRKVSDSVVVLHQGEVYARGSASEIASDNRVIDIYLGSDDGGH